MENFSINEWEKGKIGGGAALRLVEREIIRVGERLDKDTGSLSFSFKRKKKFDGKKIERNKKSEKKTVVFFNFGEITEFKSIEAVLKLSRADLVDNSESSLRIDSKFGRFRLDFAAWFRTISFKIRRLFNRWPSMGQWALRSSCAMPLLTELKND